MARPRTAHAVAALVATLSVGVRSAAAEGPAAAEFGRAVERISGQLGAPIDAAQANAEAPCGGLAGPGCSGLTFGLEVAKLAVPLAAHLWDERAGAVADVLAEAATIHAVWHDAFGYVRGKLGRGPGYVYAGCLLGGCDASDAGAGQLDGLLYQVLRVLVADEAPRIVDAAPACGPRCDLGD